MQVLLKHIICFDSGIFFIHKWNDIGLLLDINRRTGKRVSLFSLLKLYTFSKVGEGRALMRVGALNQEFVVSIIII